MTSGIFVLEIKGGCGCWLTAAIFIFWMLKPEKYLLKSRGNPANGAISRSRARAVYGFAMANAFDGGKAMLGLKIAG